MLYIKIDIFKVLCVNLKFLRILKIKDDFEINYFIIKYNRHYRKSRPLCQESHIVTVDCSMFLLSLDNNRITAECRTIRSSLIVFYLFLQKIVFFLTDNILLYTQTYIAFDNFTSHTICNST